MAALEKCGIRRSDRRLTDFMAYLRERQAEEGQIVLGSNVESLLLDFETFDKLVETNLVLFDTVFNKRLVIPDFQVTPTLIPFALFSFEHFNAGPFAFTFMPFNFHRTT